MPKVATPASTFLRGVSQHASHEVAPAAAVGAGGGKRSLQAVNGKQRCLSPKKKPQGRNQKPTCKNRISGKLARGSHLWERKVTTDRASSKQTRKCRRSPRQPRYDTIMVDRLEATCILSTNSKHMRRESIFVERMTSGRKLKASRGGSKDRRT